jgi:WhiB family redox-sensing transcriptional regulator
MALADRELFEALMFPGDSFMLTDLIPPKPAWMAEAACRDRPEVNFFPVRDEPSAAAREVCAGCPVREECLIYALDDDSLQGVWGGTSALQRRAMRCKGSQEGSQRRRLPANSHGHVGAGTAGQESRGRPPWTAPDESRLHDAQGVGGSSPSRPTSRECCQAGSRSQTM